MFMGVSAFLYVCMYICQCECMYKLSVCDCVQEYLLCMSVYVSECM